MRALLRVNPQGSGTVLQERLSARTASDEVFTAEFGVQAELPRWILSGERRVQESFDGHRVLTTRWLAEKPRGTLILFQGRGESAYRWEATTRYFAKVQNLNVITLDWPGQGFSGRFADGNAHHVDVEGLVEHGRHFLEELDRRGELVRPVTLHGYSMGGLVAARGGEREAAWGMSDYLAKFFEHGPREATDDATWLRRQKKAARRLPSMNVGGASWGFLRSSAKLIDHIADHASTIRIPTLVISGERDRVVSNESHRTIAARIPGAQSLLIPGAKHAAHIDTKAQRRAYVDAVSAFTARA